MPPGHCQWGGLALPMGGGSTASPPAHTALPRYPPVPVPMPRPTPQLVAVGLGAITIAAALWWRCYGRAVSARAPAPAGPWAEISSGAPDEPRGARWLASHWAPDPQRRRSTVPLVFRASATPTGLRPLDLRDYIDVEPRDAFEPQVRLKRRLLNGPTAARFYASLAGERPQVLAAEAEVLAMLLDHLEQRFPQHYQVQRSAGGVATAVRELITGAAFAVEDYAACPLKLCGQLVQEDFVLLSPGRRAGAGAGAPPCLVAGCATYTFMEIGLRGEKSNMDLGKSVPHIHDPVPGFNDANGIGPKVARLSTVAHAPCSPTSPHSDHVCAFQAVSYRLDVA